MSQKRRPTLRERAEVVARASPPDISATSEDEIRRQLHELQVREIELEMQNEELRRVQLELEEARDRYSDLYDFAPIGYLTLEPDTTVREANLTAASLLGIERRRILGRKFTSFVAPASQDDLYRNYRAVFETGMKQSCELLLRRADGTTFPARIESLLTEARTGVAQTCRCVISDITARKQAEIDVQTREERYRLLFDANPYPMYVHAEDSLRILEVNDAMTRLYGWSREELLTMRATELRPAEDVPEFLAVLAAQRGSRSVSVGVRRHQRKDGTCFEAEATISCITDASEPVRLVRIDDITERRRAEAAQRKQMERLEFFSETARDLLAESNTMRCVERIFDRLSDLMDLDVGLHYVVAPGGTHLDLAASHGVPEDKLPGVQRLRFGEAVCGTVASRGEPMVVENVQGSTDVLCNLIRGWGLAFYACYPVRIRERVLGTFSFGSRRRTTMSEEAHALLRTVSSQVATALDRLQAMDALETSEERFRSLAEAVPQLVWIAQRDGRVVYYNSRAGQYQGLKRAPDGSWTWHEAIHPDDRAGTLAAWQNSLESGEPFQIEHRLLMSDGSFRWHLSRGILAGAREDESRWYGTSTDVNQLKEAETQLQALNATLEHRVAERTRALVESEERLSTILNTAAEGIVTLDLGRRIESMNAAALRMFGYDLGELAGQPVDLILADPARSQFSEWLEGGQPGGGKILAAKVREVAGRRRDGSTIPLEVVAAGFTHRGRQGIVAMFRDVSERKRLERELVEVGDRERQQVGSELHDDLGQILHGVHFLAAELEGRLGRQGVAEAAELGRVTRFLKGALDTTRNLAHGLQPVPQVPEGLMTALREQAARVRRLYGIKCRFHCPNPVSVSQPTIATHLFRIAQEAVTNAVKHSHCTRVDISLKAGADRLILGVRDDGDGKLPHSGRRRGMGLHIMQFRAAAINGTLVVQQRAEGGTEVVCSVDLGG